MEAVLARLATHRLLGSAPVAEREWLAAHGTPKTLEVGEVLTHRDVLAEFLHIYFSGAVAIHVDRGAGSHKIIEWHAGDVGGHLPFSRGARAPNDAVAEERTELLLISVRDLPEMIRECPVATATLVHVMLDRTRQFSANDLRDEKLLSLGRLAAGLAHELNNPASAAARSAKLLAESLAAADRAAAVVGAAKLSDDQWKAIEGVRRLCTAPAAAEFRTAMARADREDTISEWLEAHDADEACAVPLADTSLTLHALDALAARVNGDALGASLKWIAAGCVVRALASEIETAASRIHDLVGSVKGFTFMDRAPRPEPVDIRGGINDTFTMLGAKRREKQAEVSVEFDAKLPRAHAVGGELNQVWMNLIDNALDAVAKGGHVSVTAGAEHGKLVVRITDDGGGIPAEILGRIFDPFFTTKEVGKGTGLGLDIVRRILQRHAGEIEVDSRPGHTEFRVLLPLAR